MIPAQYKKAFTLSFDDGVLQDERLIAILDRLGLRATFNLNSGLLGRPDTLVRNGVTVDHSCFAPQDVRRVYAGHEVAAHTLTHPRLTQLSDDEVVRQVEEDRLALSALCGYEVLGMAYPCGGVNNDERVAEVIRTRTGIRYSRTITSTESFAPQTNLFRFNPTLAFIDFDAMERLGEEFLAAQPGPEDAPLLYYVWGHSYELDAFDAWERFEAFLTRMSGHADVFYGTNREVLLADGPAAEYCQK